MALRVTKDIAALVISRHCVASVHHPFIEKALSPSVRLAAKVSTADYRSSKEEVRMNRQLLGKQGEKVAEQFLRKKGYRVVERNYRCPAGEVDLILLDRRVIVFVEVKTRTDHRFGTPLEAVERRKQIKMIQAAQFFLSQKRLHEREARFDVVGISWSNENPVIEHIVNAFQLV